MSSAKRNLSRRTRRVTGAIVALGGAAALLLAVAARTGADESRADELVFRNASGVQRTITTAPTFDTTNPFFQDLGTNGRTCFTCHRPAQA